jgi:Tol biopolymer transport system component
VAWLWAGGALVAQRADELFAQALVAERTKGAVEAIALYQQVVDRHAANRQLGARALAAIGRLQEKRGQVAEARRAYERIGTEFGDQRDIAADASGRLARLADPAAPSSVDILRRVCSGCGEYGFSSLSADGRLLAFDRDGDLFVRDTVSHRETAILTDPSDAARFPLLSPDGRRIAYVRLWDPDRHDLRIVANEAGAEPRVLNDNPAYYRLIPTAWEPDGKSILAIAHMNVDDTWMLALVSTSHGTVRHLTTLSWRFHLQDTQRPPRLSPDGRRVAYAALVTDRPPGSPRSTPLDDSHIYVLSLDGSTPEIALVQEASRNESPVWTPDGRQILFVSNRGRDWGVWSADVESGELRQVRGIAGRMESVGVTRSGSYVYRVPPPSGNRPRESFSVSTRTAASAVVSSQDVETIFGKQPTWSPDGSHIAFLRDEEIAGQTALRTSVFVHSIETGNEERHVVPGGNVMGFWWLNDSRGLLVWTGNRDRPSEIHRVNLVNGEVTRIGPATRYTRVLPSADRQTLFASVSGRDYEAGGRTACETLQIVAMDVSSGNSRAVASVSMPRVGNESLSLSADARTLFLLPCSRFERRADGAEIPYFKLSSVDVTTGEQRDVLVVPAAQSIERVSLAPDGRTLAVLSELIDVGAVRSVARSNVLGRVGVDGAGYRELRVASYRDGAYIDTNSLSWTPNGAGIRLCEGVSMNAPCLPIEIDADGQGGVREAPPPDGRLYSPDGVHVITVSPNRITSRGLWETWAMDIVTSALTRAPQ